MNGGDKTVIRLVTKASMAQLNGKRQGIGTVAKLSVCNPVYRS